MKKGECEEKGRDAQLGKRKMEPGTELKKKEHVAWEGKSIRDRKRSQVVTLLTSLPNDVSVFNYAEADA